MTGYLTQRGIPDGNRYNLAIPNREIRNIITEHILSMFKDKVKNDGEMANAFCNALIEGNKERTQAFEGTILKKRGSGVGKTITVRKIFQGVGVERVFPVYSPRIEKITVVRRGDVKRAKLYYLRERSGKATRIREKIEKK